MTRAILFDLGNTLVHYYRAAEFPAVLRECLRCAAAAAGAGAADPGVLLEKALELNREAEDFAVRRLEDRLAGLFPGCDRADARVTGQICRAFMMPIFACARLADGAHDVLDDLRARGLRTAVVSNTPWGSPAELWREELRRHGLLERLDAATFCVDVGWRKPHPAPYLRTLQVLTVQPADAVFVGDDPRWDVEGARRAGLRPVLIAGAPPERVSCDVIPHLGALRGVCAEAWTR